MDSKKLVNQTVMHKTFGNGIIRSVDEKYLEVDFTEKGKISKFSYPSCFYGFLSIKDISLQPEIDAVVEVWKHESGTMQKEELKKRYEKTIHDIETRRIAAEEKKLKAAQKAIEHHSTYINTKQKDFPKHNQQPPTNNLARA